MTHFDPQNVAEVTVLAWASGGPEAPALTLPRFSRHVVRKPKLSSRKERPGGKKGHREGN